MWVWARLLYEVSPQFQKHLDLDYSSESIKHFCFSVCYSWIALSGSFEPITTYYFFGAFSKLRKTTINFVMSVRPHGTTRRPLDGFSWNFIIMFLRKSVETFQVWLNFDKNNRYFTLSPVYIMAISRWLLLRIINVSDKSCRENQSTHFMFNIFSPLKIIPFMRQCAKMWWKQTGHRLQYNTAYALFVLDTYGYRHTLIICNTYCFSTATMVTRTPQYYVIFT
jgi:hypothetical protein